LTDFQTNPPAVIEWMIHLLELSVVLGIGVTIWILKSKKKNG
jgi:hypothetical protein